MEQLTSKSTQFDNALRHHQIMTFAQFITERQMANAYESQITAILDTLGKEGYTFKRTTQTGSIIKIFTKKARFIVVQELLSLFPNSRISHIWNGFHKICRKQWFQFPLQKCYRLRTHRNANL